MSAHKSIMAGLEETFEYVSGTTDGTMIHEIEIPEFDVLKSVRIPVFRKVSSPRASASPKERW